MILLVFISDRSGPLHLYRGQNKNLLSSKFTSNPPLRRNKTEGHVKGLIMPGGSVAVINPSGGAESLVQYSPATGLVYIFNLIVGTGALTLPAAFHDAGYTNIYAKILNCACTCLYSKKKIFFPGGCCQL